MTDTARPAVHLRRHNLTATITVPDKAAAALLRRTVPPSGRNYNPGRDASWSIYEHHVDPLVAAFTKAGYPVVQAATPTPRILAEPSA